MGASFSEHLYVITIKNNALRDIFSQYILTCSMAHSLRNNTHLYFFLPTELVDPCHTQWHSFIVPITNT